MLSNTKLTREQKHAHIEMLAELKFSGGEIARCGDFTVAKIPEFPGSRMAHFAVAVCSPNEAKNRRKVGEFHALQRLQDFVHGNWISLPATIGAQRLADMLDQEYITFLDKTDEPIDTGFSWGNF